ncbi:MAG: PIN domain-containing protein [Chthoniobacterales bacterium]
MSARALIDTGALLALLDQSDDWHERCLEAFKELPLPLGTSAAVLAELFHLLDPHLGELDAAWRFLHSGAITVLGIDNSDLLLLKNL